jgi:hypothetical protein
MQTELLWLEAVLKLAAGGLLLLFPRTLARALGLPPVGETFWPRMLGAIVLGLAAATVLEGHTAGRNGLGLAGHVAINLSVALAIVALLILGRAGTAKRGRFLLAVTAIGLAVLALFELAYV